MSSRSRIAAVAASATVLLASLVGASSPASAADLIGAHVCVSSSVREPATLTWRFPEGTPSQWLDGTHARIHCANGSAEKDRISAEAVVHFGGPTLHQTWTLGLDPLKGSEILFDLEGPDGVGGLEVLHKGSHFSVTANGVTATVAWEGNDGARPRVRFFLLRAA